MENWATLAADAPDFIRRLRELGRAEIHLRLGVGNRVGYGVEVPAARLVLQGELKVNSTLDQFSIVVPGWNENDFALFTRRRGRGRTDYWQGAVEYRPGGRPAVTLYLTAPLDGLVVRVRDL